MFALLALLCFFAALIGFDHLGVVNLVYLGWCFIALHMLWGVGIPWRARRNPPA